MITAATTTTEIAVSDSSIILFISARASMNSPIVYAMCITLLVFLLLQDSLLQGCNNRLPDLCNPLVCK